MTKEEIIEELKQKQEINPDEYDGSYELMREIVASYAKLDSFEQCDIPDMNAIYAMAIGTWRLNIERKKDYVLETCLPDTEKARLTSLLDTVWDNSSRGKYIHCRHDNKPSIGMFGTAFYDFGKVASDDAKRFIEMLVEIHDLNDDDEIFDKAGKLLNRPFKGMQAASASVMLHCLKPMTFPILNNNGGHGTIFEFLGISLVHPKESTSYISNCRAIKAYRDSNFSFKNYRILDLMAWEIEGDDKPEGDEQVNKKTFDHNIILYGPPGTGKTYNTVNYAVAICRPDLDVESMSHEELLTVFNELKDQGRIAFTTFHQSYGYEEFIEGIKPKMTEGDENTDLIYDVVPGVFKTFCEKALLPSAQKEADYGLNKNPSVWKVSLGHTYDNPTRSDCMENGHIRIGWDEYGEDLPETEDNYSGKAVLNSYYNKMKVGDIILSCYTSSTIDAIGVVTGECEWHPEYDEHKRLRKVRWLVKGINEDIVELNGGSTMTLSTVYKMKIPTSAVFDIVKKYENSLDEDSNIEGRENFVFIIDEINRGNISKIFGELITLIEETKRAGAPEAMDARLPYSGEAFSVPDNVYILGTMNTADRSIALMDTALRRRFSFVEMPARPEILTDINAQYVTEGPVTVDVVEMLRTINKRIEVLYDREHTIGHAFFTRLKDDPSCSKLADIFKRSVIPLLQEYFYEDYSKIQLILGDNEKSDDNYKFIRKNEETKKEVFKGNPDIDMDESERFYVNDAAFDHIESYLEIYE